MTAQKAISLSTRIVALIFIATNAWFGIAPISSVGHRQSTIFFHGMDFTLRMNEIDCLKHGYNPYHIWSKAINVPPYYPYIDPIDNYDVYNKPINAYTPWEYTYMLPLSYIPLNIAWAFHLLIKYLSVLIIGIFAYKFGIEAKIKKSDCLTLSLGVLLTITFPIWRDLENGNFGLPITASILLMIACLRRGRQIPAGILWAFAMFKPQMALLLLIPLLIRKQYLTILTAGLICAIGCIPPMLMCKTSIPSLLIQSVSASAHAFTGSGIIPYPAMLALEQIGIGESTSKYLAILIGLVMCTLLTFAIRRSKSWTFLFLPAAGLSVSWTYTGWSNYCINAIPFLIFATHIVKSGTIRDTVSFAFFLPWLACTYIGIKEVTSVCSGVFSWCQIPDFLHHTLHTMEMTFILLAACYAIFRAKKSYCNLNTTT